MCFIKAQLCDTGWPSPQMDIHSNIPGCLEHEPGWGGGRCYCLYKLQNLIKKWISFRPEPSTGLIRGLPGCWNALMLLEAPQWPQTLSRATSQSYLLLTGRILLESCLWRGWGILNTHTHSLHNLCLKNKNGMNYYHHLLCLRRDSESPQIYQQRLGTTAERDGSHVAETSRMI